MTIGLLSEHHKLRYCINKTWVDQMMEDKHERVSKERTHIQLKHKRKDW
jgi:hypothetical protein